MCILYLQTQEAFFVYVTDPILQFQNVDKKAPRRRQKNCDIAGESIKKLLFIHLLFLLHIPLVCYTSIPCKNTGIVHESITMYLPIKQTFLSLLQFVSSTDEDNVKHFGISRRTQKIAIIDVSVCILYTSLLSFTARAEHAVLWRPCRKKFHGGNAHLQRMTLVAKKGI